ncbi:hypothetical protein HanPSC8_Chr07g0303401 [Helianthus annuus]|nr:hypothetical protein HanPSC8_Chr07g0303401 [Helianthus annuus]
MNLSELLNLPLEIVLRFNKTRNRQLFNRNGSAVPQNSSVYRAKPTAPELAILV